MEKLIEQIKSFEYDDLEYFNTIISIKNSENIWVKETGDQITVNFLYRRENEDGSFEYIPRYTGLERIIINKELDPFRVLTRDLRLKFYSQFNDVFSFKERGIKSIIINETDEYEKIGESLHFNKDLYFEIISEFEGIYDFGRSYSKKVVKQKSNELLKSYFGIEKEKKNIRVGNFIIHYINDNRLHR